MKKILVFGSYVTDLTAWTAEFPRPGETVTGSFKMGPGGKGSNQAVAAHRAGADMRLVTKIGADAFGREALAFYREEGICTDDILVDESSETGVALISVNKNAQNCIVVCPGACGKITKEDVERCRELICAADIVLLQLEINFDALFAVMEIAHAAGCTIILNPAPAATLPDEYLAMVDIVTPNEWEANVLTGVSIQSKEDALRAAKAFLAKGVKEVVITLGDQGVFVYDGQRAEQIGRLPVEAVDTTGAGDAFNGGFVTALAEGADLFEAVRFGNAAGALSVTKKGTARAMPSRAEIDALYREHYGK